ncbi:MAG: hypothetical protein M3P49_15865 [Actinomycetota bacterium]|nr:hypothetical protein [Actinomycetota bacterium]
MDTLLEEHLKEVERADAALAPMRRELAERSPETKAAKSVREEDRLMHLERAGRLKRGAGKLPEGFWDLPRPEDPTDSVRQALEEDRG